MHTLTIYVKDEELYDIYLEKSETHNVKIWNTSYYDAGFDLYTPSQLIVKAENKVKLNTDIVAVMNDENGAPACFYMYPRSSISKTPLRLANSVGIIDSGYRGNLIGVFDNISKGEEYIIEKHSRLLQIWQQHLKNCVSM